MDVEPRPEGWVQIEYEDGTVVEGRIPDGSLLHNAGWIDWLVAANTPDVLAEFITEQNDSGA